MKKMIIGFTVLLIVCYGITVSFINRTSENNVDVTVLNAVVKSIEEELQADPTSGSRSGTTAGMAYESIFTTDKDYQARLFEAIKNSNTVMDLTKPSASGRDEIFGKVIFSTDSFQVAAQKNNLLIGISIIFLIIVGGVYGILGSVYFSILKPFGVMKQFAQKIADGDLEFKLPMDRGNYFGAFTESFDLMREELRKARQGEYQANISKKELVAELSHDIKTPVATIKAICELLLAKLDGVKTDAQQGATAAMVITESIEKIEVINSKADVIDALIGNLFHATLEELEMLKVNVGEHPSTVILQMFKDIDSFGKIHFKNDLAECLIVCDSLRLSQVIDNIISNSYKYADTAIDIWFNVNKTEKKLAVTIKDYGDGVDPDECPLVCEKFFRGSGEKVKNIPGSGLGLYLAKQFIEAMGGTIYCYNANGFMVELQLKMA
ncbi:HAMP domain-containing sensor histidine kinase [Acetobacterium woodii]|uniref:histidine kinase n=1 Tax=Acetobacterium woodii (strain ATCC 29683 / DSM 1030 / JCM 2381 / KCTC 1655 / WB1) TaxID=931626 RepID=H6LFM4_ACEWD|nr:HAMP domain-containing sensor histidine kinase [Acetobacterium woodii]AFA46969.1 sensor histidine kinase [Acetobacterium woodii DSM 1030]